MKTNKKDAQDLRAEKYNTLQRNVQRRLERSTMLKDKKSQ